jgi:hypothetical protein
VEVGGPLEQGVYDVGDEESGHKGEDPLTAGVEIAFESVIFADLFGEEQSAEQIEDNGVERDEEVKGKGPLADAGQIEFPPPEVNEIKKEEQHPDQVNPVHPEPLGMLDDAGHALEKMSHTQAHDHPEEHFDVKV